MREFISMESLMIADMQLRCIRVFAHVPGYAGLLSLALLLEGFCYISVSSRRLWTHPMQERN
jgi:hypothetical protein